MKIGEVYQDKRKPNNYIYLFKHLGKCVYLCVHIEVWKDDGDTMDQAGAGGSPLKVTCKDINENFRLVTEELHEMIKDLIEFTYQMWYQDKSVKIEKVDIYKEKYPDGFPDWDDFEV